MSFLNNNNFCHWLDIDSTPEFTQDGDFDNGVSSNILPGWDMIDTSPVGSNVAQWTWISASDDHIQVTNGVLLETNGCSQERDIKKGNVYCVDLRLNNAQASDTTFYFHFVKGNDSQLMKSIVINNAVEEHRFFVRADSDYNKVMVTAISATFLQCQVYRFEVYEFDECFYSLPLVEHDILSLFVNADLDSDNITFATLKLGLLKDYEMYLPDIAALNQLTIAGTLYSVYSDDWAVPILADGNYRLALYDDSGGFDFIYYISNSFTKSTSKRFTSIVKYRNSADSLGYLYSSVPSFYNQFRVDLWSGRSNFPENITGYETYNGGFIKTKSDITKLREFETRFFDEGAHEAFASMLAHSEVLIDDVEHKKTNDGDYSISWSDDDDNKIGNGSVNLLIVDYSSAIKIC